MMCMKNYTLGSENAAPRRQSNAFWMLTNTKMHRQFQLSSAFLPFFRSIYIISLRGRSNFLAESVPSIKTGE